MTNEVNIQRDLTRLVIGLAIILAGILFTLDNLRLIHAEAYLRYWPVLLVALGIVKMVQANSWGSYGWSVVWIIVGLWWLADNIGLISVSIWALWPLLLVLIGGNIIWRACCPPQLRATVLIRGDQAANTSAPPRDSFVRAVALMSGVERASDSTEFRGADLLAIMGGCEVDLRRATMAGDEAVIDVMAIMGGVEISVPEGWTVEAKVLPILGGMSDETHPNKSGPAKRLVIRGLAVMGGVGVKN